MPTLNLAISYALQGSFPPTTTVAGISATIVGTAAGNTTPQTNLGGPTETSVSFSVIPDTYNYSVVAVDSSTPPVALGTAVTGSFVVTAPATIQLSLPQTVVPSQS
jgi:hypothetical protein